MSAIDLMLDEENELTFQLNVEGTRPADEASARLVLINEDMSLVFDAQKFSNGEVSIILPPLNHVLREGKYEMDLEVIVDDRYFRPLTLEGNFEKSIVITAEAVVKPRKRKARPTARLVEVSKTNKSEPIVTVKNSKTQSKAASLASSLRKPKKRQQVQKAKPAKNIVETKKIATGDISDNDILNIIKALTKQK